MGVKGNQTNITDSTLFTMQLNYTNNYYTISLYMHAIVMCVCARARENVVVLVVLEQFETSPETIEQKLRPAVCYQRHI